MWAKTYSAKLKGYTLDQIWSAWTDVNNWSKWQDDIEFSTLKGDFKRGNLLSFKPKGGPTLKIEIIEVIPNKQFTDVTNFFLAKMYDKHELIQHENEVEIKSTISIQGLLSFLWRKLVVENIANGLEDQTSKLINYIHVKYKS